MKKIFLIGLLSVLAISTALADNELNEKQLALRSEIFTALGKEGYEPDYNEDGEIFFTLDDEKYYIAIDYRRNDPFLATIYNQFSYSEEYSEDVMKNCINLVSQYKTIKLYCMRTIYLYESEIFFLNSESVIKSIKPVIGQLLDARNEVRNIVNSGIGDLDFASEKAKILERGKSFFDKEDYAKSAAIFKMLANAGYLPSFRYMGDSYKIGAGVEKNAEKMISYYEKAIDGGDYLCAYQLANYYYEKKDYQKAYSTFQKCASNENENKSNAMYMMGYMQEDGLGMNKSLIQAIQIYRKSLQYSTKLESDARLALMRLGEVVEKEEDFVDATKTMLMGVRNAKEMYELGNEYENGLNKRYVSLPKAYAYYKASADKDYTRGLVKMGDIFISKYYPFADKVKSDKYYQRAFKAYSQIAGANGEACYEIGNMYKNGLGVKKDIEQAKYYYKKGAMMKDKNACYEYGLICKNELEFPEAFSNFKLSAEAGHELAMYELAKLYEDGTGTNRDQSKAIEWYKRCAETNCSLSSEAQKALKRLSSNDEKI